MTSIPPPAGIAAAEPRPRGLLLARVGGVPIRLAPSWWIVAAAIVVLFRPPLPGRSPLVELAVAGGYVVLLALSVLVHEVAHAETARRMGYAVQEIVLTVWGGHTSFLALRPGPWRSALVALAGPTANGLLALLAYLALPLVGPPPARFLVGATIVANLFLAGLNALPGHPFDGGFVLESLVWGVTGRRSAGLTAAGWAGRLLVVALVGWWLLVPLWRGERADLWTASWVALVGAFLWQGASGAVRAGRDAALLDGLCVGALTRPVVAVPVDHPAAAIAEAVTTAGGEALPVLVDAAGRAVGLVDPTAHSSLPPEHAARVPAGALLLMQPDGWLRPAPDPREPVGDLVAELTAMPYGVLVLTDEDARPVAALTASDVQRTVSSGAGRRP